MYTRTIFLTVTVYMLVCVYTRHMQISYLTVIVVHEMHGRMHHNHCQITYLHVSCTPFIIGLPYDDPPTSPSQQLAYKNFDC